MLHVWARLEWNSLSASSEYSDILKRNPQCQSKCVQTSLFYKHFALTSIFGFLLLGWWCFSIQEFFLCGQKHSVSGRGVFCQPLSCSQNLGNLFFDPPESRIRRGFGDITDSFRRDLPGHLYESKTQWDGVFLNCHPCPSFGRCPMSSTTRIPPRIQPDSRRPLLSAILHLGHCNEDFFLFPLVLLLSLLR